MSAEGCQVEYEKKVESGDGRRAKRDTVQKSMSKGSHNGDLCTRRILYIVLKGSVQRKLRWVKNGVNRSVGASDCGAGHSFVFLFRFHLGYAIFPFPVSTAQIIGEFWINR